MSKVYLITDADIERLKTMLTADPRHGTGGGSSHALSKAEEQAHQDAHRFFWYHVHRWLDEVKE